MKRRAFRGRRHFAWFVPALKRAFLAPGGLRFGIDKLRYGLLVDSPGVANGRHTSEHFEAFRGFPTCHLLLEKANHIVNQV